MVYTFNSHPIANRILTFIVILSIVFTMMILKPAEAYASPLLVAGIAPYLVPILVSMVALGFVFTDTVSVVPVLEQTFNGLSSTIKNSLSSITEHPESVTVTPTFLNQVQSATMSSAFIQAMLNGDIQYRILSDTNYKLLQYSEEYGNLSSAMENRTEKAIQYIPVEVGVDTHLMGNFWLRLMPYASSGAFQLHLVEKSGAIEVSTEYLSSPDSSYLHYDNYEKPFYFGFYTWFYQGIIRMAICSYAVNADGTYPSSPSNKSKIYHPSGSATTDIFMGMILSGAAFADGSATSGLVYNPALPGVVDPQTATDERTYSIPAPPLPIDAVSMTPATVADGTIDGAIEGEAPTDPTDPDDPDDEPLGTLDKIVNFIKSIATGIAAAVTLGATVIATLATAGSDLMNAIPNMFSWLPDELEMAIIAALSVMIAFSVFKFLRG